MKVDLHDQRSYDFVLVGQIKPNESEDGRPTWRSLTIPRSFVFKKQLLFRLARFKITLLSFQQIAPKTIVKRSYCLRDISHNVDIETFGDVSERLVFKTGRPDGTS